MGVMHLSNSYRRQLGVNAGIACTQVLIYQALHDLWGFGRKRFAIINDLVDQYSKDIDHCGARFSFYRNALDDVKLSERLKRDYISWMKKGIEVSGKAENVGSEAGMEYTYVLMIYAICKQFGFKQKKIQRLQEKLKFYARLILDGEVMIVEFMKCMELECGQKFKNLKDWEAMNGELKIYG